MSEILTKEIMNKIDELELLANQGDEDAQHHIGWLYFVNQDYVKATEWYKIAAKNGHEKSQYHIGTCYYHGYQEGNIKQSYKESFKWHKMAAEQGDRNSQSTIAEMYYKGKGVKKDYVEAVRWYKKTDENNHGYKFAQLYMDKIIKEVKKSGDNKLLCDILKTVNSDEYKLEIKSLEKMI